MGPIRLELDCCIEPIVLGIGMFIGEALNSTEVELANSKPLRLFPPHGSRSQRIRYPSRAINQKYRTSVDANVTVIGKCGCQPTDVSYVVLGRIMLCDQDVAI